jgi:hypothetical protein
MTWKVLKVGTDLYAPDNSDPHFGVAGKRINGIIPYFLIPRAELMHHLPLSPMSELYNSLEQCLLLKKVYLSRGKAKTVFGDPGKRIQYKCVGVHPSINSAEVVPYPSWSESLGPAHWSRIMEIVSFAETVFECYVDRNVLKHICAAKRVVDFKTMSSPNFGAGFCIPTAKYFGGIAFGKNVFLRAHADDDFTFSVSLVLPKGCDYCSVDDSPLAHFCYPTHGIAIPMRPGDLVPFNSRIPHCISSRSKLSDDIMCISLYLKTAVVGLNDNTIPLDPIQTTLSTRYGNDE